MRAVRLDIRDLQKRLCIGHLQGEISRNCGCQPGAFDRTWLRCRHTGRRSGRRSDFPHDGLQLRAWVGQRVKKVRHLINSHLMVGLRTVVEDLYYLRQGGGCGWHSPPTVQRPTCCVRVHDHRHRGRRDYGAIFSGIARTGRCCGNLVFHVALRRYCR